MTKRNFGRHFNVSGLAVALALLMVWEIAVDLKIADYDYLPAPSGIAEGLLHLAESGDLSVAVAHTLTVFLLTWAFSMVFGLLGGLVVGLSKGASQWTMASVDIFRSLPTIALIPAALLVFGPSTKGEIVVATYAATWPMLLNVAGGVRSVHPRLYELGTMIRISPLAQLFKITLPASAPALLVGARISMGLSLVVAVVAEMIGFPSGIGFGIVEQENALQSKPMWAYVLVAGAIGWLLNWALIKFARAMLPGAANVLSDDQ